VNRLTERIVLGACLLGTLFVALYATATGDDKQMAVVLLVGAFVALALIGVGLVASISGPMQRASAAARRYGHGDFSARVPAKGVEELRQLAASMNEMAVAMDAARAKLREQASSLAVSKEQAERAANAKTEFLSRMSHELRTPLNAILGFAQLLELDELTAMQKDNVAHIVSGGRHLLDLINEVLEITRLDVGSASPTIEPVSVEAMVREVVELVSPLATQRKIDMRAALGSDASAWVAADAQRLKQILINLLANAVKYNRDEGSVTVTLKRLEPNRLRIRVTDTGQGIAQDQLPKLFTPFERLGAESGNVEGTGLGLVLAQRLAEAMGGSIGVESQPWIGSTFHIELPLAEAPVVDAAAADEPRAATPRRALHGEATVLYIEDDVTNVQLLDKLFADDPRIEMMTTLHGKLGLELARVHQPNLILLDLNLSDVHGSEVIRRLREDEGTRDIPVIVLSADATEESKAKLRVLGAKRYLTKPLDLDAVMNAVRDVLELEVAGVA
jgi:signal transduction histidine kinase/ActR/RegA family two-component response regulator